MTWLIKAAEFIGLYNCFRNLKLLIISRLTHKKFLGHFMTFEQKKAFMLSFDPVRYATMILAIQTVVRTQIKGDLAELGVFDGSTSKLIHSYAPDRKIYLFDTFGGFPDRDLKGKHDGRFKDTSIEKVKQKFGNLTNVIIKAGYFPDTTQGLENEQYAFVMLDADLFAPTLAGLQYFYPRLASGGYIFVHDYNSDESNFAVSQAVSKYFADKPEKIIEIPDEGGSILIRKS